jgi:hypothetical protein
MVERIERLEFENNAACPSKQWQNSSCLPYCDTLPSVHGTVLGSCAYRPKAKLESKEGR